MMRTHFIFVIFWFWENNKERYDSCFRSMSNAVLRFPFISSILFLAHKGQRFLFVITSTKSRYLFTNYIYLHKTISLCNIILWNMHVCIYWNVFILLFALTFSLLTIYKSKHEYKNIVLWKKHPMFILRTYIICASILILFTHIKIYMWLYWYQPH